MKTTINGLADRSVLNLTPGQRAVGKVVKIETAAPPAFDRSLEWKRALEDLGGDLFMALWQANPKFSDPERIGLGRVINQKLLKWALDQLPVKQAQHVTTNDLPTALAMAGDLFEWLANEDLIRQLLSQQEQAQQAQQKADGARAAAQALREAAQAIQPQPDQPEEETADNDDPMENEAGASYEGESEEAANGNQSNQSGGEGGEAAESGQDSQQAGETADSGQNGQAQGQTAEERAADLLARAMELEETAKAFQGEADRADQAGADMLDKLDDPISKYSFGQTAKEAQQHVKQLSNDLNSFGFGPGDPVRTNPGEAIALARKFGSKIARIANVIGRCRSIARKAKGDRVPNSPLSTEIGYTRDLTKILPIDRLYLSRNAPAPLRAIHVAQWANSGLPGNIPTNEGKTHGAFVAAVDCSGSMAGEAEILAKGLALGVIQAATAEHKARKWAAFQFSDSRRFPTVTSDQDWRAVMQWLETFESGGTNIGTAIQRAIKLAKMLQAQGERPDVILLTDGHGTLSERARIEWLEFAEEHNARLFYVPIGASPQPDVLELAPIVIPVSVLNDETAGRISAEIGRLL